MIGLTKTDINTPNLYVYIIYKLEKRKYRPTYGSYY